MKTRYTSIILAASIIIALIALSPYVDDALTTLHLSPKPEPFTELYFTDPASLPTHFTVGETQSVAFTVHNVEYRVERYDYTIVADTQQGRPDQLLASGDFVLRHGAYQHEVATVLLQPLGDRVKVTVALTLNSTGRRQSLAYWVTRASP